MLGYVVVLAAQGPRGIVGYFEHIAFSGRWFPITPEESSRIFWASTAKILAAEVGGLPLVLGAWRLLKRLRPHRNQGEQTTCPSAESISTLRLVFLSPGGRSGAAQGGSGASAESSRKAAATHRLLG